MWETIYVNKRWWQKGIEISKIYLLSFKWVPILWWIRSRHQYKTILKKCCMKIWHLRFLPCGFLELSRDKKNRNKPLCTNHRRLLQFFYIPRLTTLKTMFLLVEDQISPFFSCFCQIISMWSNTPLQAPHNFECYQSTYLGWKYK